MTPWIDIHAHFSPPISESENLSRWHARRSECFMVPLPNQFLWDARRTLDYMDRAGITMQMLSNIPTTSLSALQASNDFAASLVAQYPTRFGFLAALPTDDPEACLAEISRCADGEGINGVKADGFAVTAAYKGTALLSSPSLDDVWAELDRRKAGVFCHPWAQGPANFGRPAPLIEVAFETTRVAVDLLYSAHFRRHPNVKLCLAHCGGALPALSGRLLALGTEAWVPNPNGMTKEEMEEQLRALYLDTAGNTLQPGLGLVGHKHIIYGSDCGVPCTTEATAEANRQSLLAFEGLTKEEIEEIGQNALRLFPRVKERLGL
ncbi:amidohydrolase 2 [Gymnopus androsaceus JB14]|uniref:Amidohydrolase 2 n=1 Tax=Gymnopus androsaceus JB14 TaxID=1447944 RepID=A0A6A4HQT2_9AGAR|nr:amidohydrolase 2 [Gymnopus androsaceus JB14]